MSTSTTDPVAEREALLDQLADLVGRLAENDLRRSKLREERDKLDRQLAEAYIAAAEGQKDADKTIQRAKDAIRKCDEERADADARLRAGDRVRKRIERDAAKLVTDHPQAFAAAAAPATEAAEAARAKVLAALDEFAAKIGEAASAWRPLALAGLGYVEDGQVDLSQVRARIEAAHSLPAHLRDKPRDLRSLDLCRWRVGLVDVLMPADHERSEKAIRQRDSAWELVCGTPVIPDGCTHPRQLGEETSALVPRPARGLSPTARRIVQAALDG